MPIMDKVCGLRLGTGIVNDARLVAASSRFVSTGALIGR
jgi:hypothetical protein